MNNLKSLVNATYSFDHEHFLEKIAATEKRFSNHQKKIKVLLGDYSNKINLFLKADEVIWDREHLDVTKKNEIYLSENVNFNRPSFVEISVNKFHPWTPTINEINEKLYIATLGMVCEFYNKQRSLDFKISRLDGETFSRSTSRLLHMNKEFVNISQTYTPDLLSVLEIIQKINENDTYIPLDLKKEINLSINEIFESRDLVNLWNIINTFIPLLLRNKNKNPAILII